MWGRVTSQIRNSISHRGHGGRRGKTALFLRVPCDLCESHSVSASDECTIDCRNPYETICCRSFGLQAQPVVELDQQHVGARRLAPVQQPAEVAPEAEGAVGLHVLAP